MQKLSNEQFINRSLLVHGDQYDYSRCNYEHSLKKVEIICKKHGSFFIKPSNHINNKQGCPVCGRQKTGDAARKPLDLFISQVKEKENSENYDLFFVNNFKNKKEKIKIVCNKHGEYLAAARDVLRSKYFGCKKCRIEDDTFNTKIFIDKAKKIHGNNFCYEKVDYKKSHDEIIVTCKKHGDFPVKPYIHLQGGGFCPKCTEFVSSYEIELENFLKENNINGIETSFRKFKDIKEVDILAKEQKIAIEFNGLFWHSERFKSKNYHLDKTNKLNSLGYRLIHIFEDEWVNKKDICKSMLLNSFGINHRKIFARKCSVIELKNEDRNFLNKNHIQGYCPASVKLGLAFEGELVAVMTFGKKRICLGSKHENGHYELLRFCNLLNGKVIGGASKLFTFFVKKYKPLEVISYCDKRWGTGNLYNKLGFTKCKDTMVNYFYIKGNNRYHRFKFRKQILVKQGYSSGKTEKQIMEENGYNRIYDCGNFKFKWLKNINYK